jgi:hypothetical protein
MSYKYAVLKDKPIAFYRLDEVASSDITSYDILKTMFPTYQDLKDSGISYAAISGLPVYDFSGNFNDGFSTNASNKKVMPLFSGGERGTQVLPDTAIYYPVKGIASKFYPDNIFSIEAWVLINDTTTTRVNLVSDPTNNIGLFYENGNIVFSVQGQEVSYTYPQLEAMHIVGTFSPGNIALYINSELKSVLNLDDFKFTNSTLSFLSGLSAIQFFIDGVAFYKTELSQKQIGTHYNYGVKNTNVASIVYPDGGYLFSMNSSKIKPSFKYSYPIAKKWSDLANENISISADQSYLYFEETQAQESKQFIFTDYIVVPSYLGITTSQIYWDGAVKGIKIEVSLDNQNWIECKNGSSIPYFNKNEDAFQDVLFIKVTMSTTDSRKFLPVLKSIDLVFFEDQSFYSDNSSFRIISDYEYCLPETNSRPLSFNRNNGLFMFNGKGFGIEHNINVRSVEMLFTPDGASSVLLSTNNELFSWNSAGVISKNGIDSIYVNGENVTSAVNIFEYFIPGIQHHVILNLNQDISTNIRFNQNQSGSVSGGKNLYNNLAIYPVAITPDMALRHYLNYIGLQSIVIEDTSISLAEKNTGTDSLPYFFVSEAIAATNI